SGEEDVEKGPGPASELLEGSDKETASETEMGLSVLPQVERGSFLQGTKEFFSLLSIVSYSSYAFHKVSIVLYNISSLRSIDPTKFSTRYCYCINNRTNDLTDFTALLVDIVGNSTSYLTEIFKSTSIVSVSQSNDTDCIYICVMSGRIGRNLTDLWEAIEKSPIVNYTFSGNISDFLGEEIRPGWLADFGGKVGPIFQSCSSHKTGPLVIPEQLLLHLGALACHGLEEQLLQDDQRASPTTTAALEYGTDFPTNVSKPPSVKIHVSGPWDLKLCVWWSLRSKRLVTPDPGHGCPKGAFFQEATGLSSFSLKTFYSSSKKVIKKGNFVTVPPLTVQKLNPCVMELCKFYQRCFCTRDRSYSRDHAMRYCTENYPWFFKNAAFICEKVKRSTYSKSK
uniref:HHLA1 neighbor of OC90 n=1 Tax=Naja naja TaxID=35670 RepID=A0A8C6YGI6_NAJNA